MATAKMEVRGWARSRLCSSRIELAIICVSAGVVVFCFAVWAYILAEYGVDVLRNDQWGTPARQILRFLDGNLTLADLVAQHNEARKLFPNLISIAVVLVRGHHDVWAELFVGFGLAIGLAALIGALAWRSFQRVAETAVVVAVFSALFWSARTGEYHMYSIGFERQLAEAALLCMLLGFLCWGTSWRAVALAIAASFVGQYSFPGAIVLWPLSIVVLLFFFEGEWKGRLGKASALLIATAFVNAWYFHGYQTPGDKSLTAIFDQTWQDGYRFFFIFLGNGFTDDARQAQVIGAITFSIFAAMALFFLINVPKRELRTVYGVWLTLGAFAVAQDVLALFTRLPMSIRNALRDDYVIYPVYLGVAIAALGLLMASTRKSRIAVSLVALGVAIGLSSTLARPGFWDWLRLREQHYEYATACLILTGHYVDQDCQRILYPWRLPQSAVIRSKRLFGAPVLDDLVVAQRGRGRIETLEVSAGHLRAHGWAAEEDEPASAVVAAVSTPSGLKILKVAEVYRPRPDVARSVERALLRGGWMIDVPVDGNIGTCDVKIFSIDIATGVLGPLRQSTPSDCSEPSRDRR